MTNRLQFGPEALIFESMQNYLPGMGLMQYFLERINGNFSEYLIYFGYAFLGASFLLPVTEHISGSKKWATPAIAIAIFLLPLSFYNSINISDYSIYYKSLFIDGLMGLAFAYSLYSAWTMKDGSVFSTLRYVMSVATLVLLKESGLLLAALSLFSFLIMQLLRKKTSPDRKTGFLFQAMPFILSISIMLLIKVSWGMILDQYNVHATGSWISFSRIVSAVFAPTESQQTIWTGFFQHLFSTALIESNWIQLSSKPWLLSWCSFMAAYLVFAIFLSSITRNRRIKQLLVIALIAEILYVFCIVFMFIAWNSFDSYVRYMNTGTLALYSILFMTTMIVFCGEDDHSTRTKISLPVLFYLFLIACLVFPFHEIRPGWLLDQYQIYHDVSDGIEATIARDGDSDRDGMIDLFLVNEGDVERVLSHHQIYNQLLTRGIAVRNWCYDTSLDTDEQNREQYLINRLIHSKTGAYQYLYISNANVGNGYLSELYADFFEGGAAAIIDDRIYRIDYSEANGSIKFILLE